MATFSKDEGLAAPTIFFFENQGMYDLDAHPANDGLWNLITWADPKKNGGDGRWETSV